MSFKKQMLIGLLFNVLAFFFVFIRHPEFFSSREIISIENGYYLFSYEDRFEVTEAWWINRSDCSGIGQYSQEGYLVDTSNNNEIIPIYYRITTWSYGSEDLEFFHYEDGEIVIDKSYILTEEIYLMLMSGGFPEILPFLTGLPPNSWVRNNKLTCEIHVPGYKVDYNMP